MKMLKFNINSIKGRVILLLSTFLSLMVITNIFVLSQNVSVQKLGKGVKDVTLPLALNGQEIILGLNKTSSIQRAYYINRNDTLLSQRAKLWEKDILPALSQLSAIKNVLDLKENVERIEKLELLIPKFQSIQEEIEQELASIIPPEIQVSLGDTIESEKNDELVQALLAREDQKKRFSEQISKKLDPLKAEIERAIDPLLDTEKDYLDKNIGDLNESVANTNYILIFLSFIGLALPLAITFFLFKQLGTSIKRPTTLLDNLSRGRLSDGLSESSDELNQVIKAGNRLNQNLAEASRFAKQIGEGNLEGDFSPAGKEDVLGNALVQMRDKLKEVSEEDKRRHWVTNGINELGIIIRQDQTDLNNLAHNILKFLIKYLEANQGALFIVNDSDQEDYYLEAKAIYAWGRKKHIEKGIRLGEGIAGQVWQEQETTYLKKVPEDYVSIASGLGEANPTNVIVIPLKYNEQVYGVLELASFETFLPYQIEFLENIAETMASSLASVKTNDKTKRLLEQTQEQAESIRAQEEEMRQNLEELQATQEAMQRKQMDLEAANEKLRQNEKA